jgi:hypothetical protein
MRLPRPTGQASGTTGSRAPLAIARGGVEPLSRQRGTVRHPSTELPGRAVAGGAMCAGADSIDDAGRLRHGAMPVLFSGIRAPSALGTFLRSFTHGHALQPHAVHRQFPRVLAAHTPLPSDAGQIAFIDVDSTHTRVFGPAEQGARVGRFKGIRTLHPLLATVCTPPARPVIAAVRLRQGKSADSRGAERFVTGALATAGEAGRTGIRVPARRQPVLRRRRRPGYRGEGVDPRRGRRPRRPAPGTPGPDPPPSSTPSNAARTRLAGAVGDIGTGRQRFLSGARATGLRRSAASTTASRASGWSASQRPS